MALRRLRQRGERAEAEGAAETEIRSYFINVWTVKRAASVRNAVKEPYSQTQKTINTWCVRPICCIDLFSEGHRANKNFTCARWQCLPRLLRRSHANMCVIVCVHMPLYVCCPHSRLHKCELRFVCCFMQSSAWD